MPLLRKEQPRYLIIMGIDIRKCQFASNTACSGWLGVCAIYKHFPRLERILLPGRVHARPLRLMLAVETVE